MRRRIDQMRWPVSTHEGSKMKHKLTIGGLTLAAALAAAPAMAQTSATHSTTTAPATGDVSSGARGENSGYGTTTAPATGNVRNTDNTGSNDRNSVMTQLGDARASKIIGADVYNSHNEKVGTIDDLLIGKHGRMSAVLSVGGFLGMDAKYVEVPYVDLTFGNKQKDSDNRVVLKGATKESLKTQAAYSYYKG
jgi:hypothetical protein